MQDHPVELLAVVDGVEPDFHDWYHFFRLFETGRSQLEVASRHDTIGMPGLGRTIQ
jgi:hypothetical protein